MDIFTIQLELRANALIEGGEAVLLRHVPLRLSDVGFVGRLTPLEICVGFEGVFVAARSLVAAQLALGCLEVLTLVPEPFAVSAGSGPAPAKLRPVEPASEKLQDEIVAVGAIRLAGLWVSGLCSCLRCPVRFCF